MAKFLECPNCSFVFKAPAMDLKFNGLGWTVPGLGVVKCPECKQQKRRKYFKQVQESDLSRNSETRSDGTIRTNSRQDANDAIEDSRFEDE